MPKMDVYSMRIVPFTVAAYARGRKYAPEVVALARALRAMDMAETEIAQAQARANAAEVEVVHAIKAVEAKMDKEGQS